MSTHATFRSLAELADRLARESSRLKKRDAIAEAAGALAIGNPDAPEAAGLFCLYLAGQPFAEADPRRLNAGGAILSRTLKAVSGASDAAMTAAYRRHGDLGAAAFDLLRDANHQPDPAPLTLAEVASAFDRMATAPTTKARAEAVETLLLRGSDLEGKYLLKLMLGDMRIGVKQSLIEEAIALAAEVEVAAVRHAVMLEADLARAVRRAFAGTLAEARMTLFHPLGFMLASPVETPEEAIERFTPKPPKPEKPAKPKRKRGKAAEASNELPADSAEQALAEDIAIEAESQSGTAAEPAVVDALIEDKFDGIRAQLHFGDASQPGRVALYSRSREDITEGFPEIAEAFARFSDDPPSDHPGSIILDGELMGWDLRQDRALPFAVLGQRIGRKRVSNDLRRQIPAVFMAFDLMCEAGELTLPLPLTERRRRLEAIFNRLSSEAVSPLELPEPPPIPKGRRKSPEGQTTLFADLVSQPGTTQDPPIGRLHLSRAERAHSAEAIDLAYRDARERANEGVMLKAAASPYLPGRRGLFWVKLKRELGTLDVVITGAEFGNGRRAQLLSDYTFAVREHSGELLNVGKAYSGVTDEEILELTAWLKSHTLEDFGHFRTVEPIRVLEVAFNNIMRSDRHASGFALRFPRILRLRDDKPVTEIDTLDRVEEIFRSQPDRPADSEEEA